ncbi:hypothetical protein BC829DRAFT_298782 [Chytridium lagenaria]|nr:hypothetical protein BC829DRAFT_298782 [Chytridium lagenaria]
MFNTSRAEAFQQLKATLSLLSEVPDPSNVDVELRVGNVKENIHANESRSLRNATLSPGWTAAEVEILRKALIRFGVGNWKEIADSGCLPGKSISQLNLQTQRLLGQQSTAEFAGLHIDPNHVGEQNQRKEGVTRKNGFIVNMGDDKRRVEKEVRGKPQKI